MRLAVPWVPFGISRLGAENPTGRASERCEMEHRSGWEHFTSNRPGALQDQQKIGRSGGIMRGAEDFVFVLLQNLDPPADVSRVLPGVVRNTPLRCQKNDRQLSAQLLLGVADIAEPVRLVESRAIQP